MRSISLGRAIAASDTAAAYIKALGESLDIPTFKQHLTVIRMLFDWLVPGRLVATMSALARNGGAPYSTQ